MVKEAKTTPRGRPRRYAEGLGKPLAIRLPDVDRETLRELAAAAGLPLSPYIVKVLKQHIEEQR